MASCSVINSSLALLLLAACQTTDSASTGDTAQKSAQKSAQNQAAINAAGLSTPPPGAPGKPAYLSPRGDGTYVDATGHVLTPPAVMLGVTMEQPGQGLVKHLGINPARSTLLVNVIPGLPANKAGIEDHDLVVAVNGNEDASPQDIRKRLKVMKPGDSITLTIRRANITKNHTLQVVAWQAEHMVRPIHSGSFAKPTLAAQADGEPSPRELAPVMDRLDRIEKQLQILTQQSIAGQSGASPAAPVAPMSPAKPMPLTKPMPSSPANQATQPVKPVAPTPK